MPPKRRASADRAVYLLGLFIAGVLLVIAVLLGWAAVQQRAHGRALLDVLRRRSGRPPPRPRREIGFKPGAGDDTRNTDAPRC